MKIFIDTNILISAALFPGSIPEKAYQKAVSYPNEAVISDMNLEELRRIFNKKFPDKVPLLSMFISILAVSVQIIRVPDTEYPEEAQIRDEKDRPIFRAALNCKADYFLTGDKDFLEAGLNNPKILSPSDFMKL